MMSTAFPCRFVGLVIILTCPCFTICSYFPLFMPVSFPHFSTGHMQKSIFNSSGKVMTSMPNKCTNDVDGTIYYYGWFDIFCAVQQPINESLFSAHISLVHFIPFNVASLAYINSMNYECALRFRLSNEKSFYEPMKILSDFHFIFRCKAQTIFP